MPAPRAKNERTKILKIVKSLLREGKSNHEIAEHLNAEGFTTTNGKPITAQKVSALKGYWLSKTKVRERKPKSENLTDLTDLTLLILEANIPEGRKRQAIHILWGKE